MSRTKPVKLCAIQSRVFPEKADSFAYIEGKVVEAMAGQPDFILLPEMFACPYRSDFFPVYAEKAGGRTWQFLSELAQRHSVYLIGGTIPEAAEGKVYNTAFSFDRSGRQIGRHRKMHLFDVDVPGGISFHESDTLTPGNDFTVVDTEFGKVGVMVCFDIRFPELSAIYKQLGADIIFVPGAFNMTTGPAHWELLFRGRAMDNQVFMLGCAPARETGGVYTSWGHTMLTDPWGRVIQTLAEGEGTLSETVDLGEILPTMQGMPVNFAKRHDLYEIRIK